MSAHFINLGKFYKKKGKQKRKIQADKVRRETSSPNWRDLHPPHHHHLPGYPLPNGRHAGDYRSLSLWILNLIFFSRLFILEKNLIRILTRQQSLAMVLDIPNQRFEVAFLHLELEERCLMNSQ